MKTRLPKADYFRKRLAEAIENGRTSKADYYRGRLEAMGEPTKVEAKGILSKATFKNGLIIYSI